jgi:thiamine kinase-like enzyme
VDKYVQKEEIDNAGDLDGRVTRIKKIRKFLDEEEDFCRNIMKPLKNPP